MIKYLHVCDFKHLNRRLPKYLMINTMMEKQTNTLREGFNICLQISYMGTYCTEYLQLVKTT